MVEPLTKFQTRFQVSLKQQNSGGFFHFLEILSTKFQIRMYMTPNYHFHDIIELKVNICGFAQKTIYVRRIFLKVLVVNIFCCFGEVLAISRLKIKKFALLVDLVHILSNRISFVSTPTKEKQIVS